MVDYPSVTLTDLLRKRFPGFDSDSSLVCVTGIVASSHVHGIVYPGEKKTRQTLEAWEAIHGSGLAVGFLYDPPRVSPSPNLLSFECRLHLNDRMGSASELALLLEVSKNTQFPLKMYGQVLSFEQPRFRVHAVELESFRYVTHNGSRTEMI